MQTKKTSTFKPDIGDIVRTPRGLFWVDDISRALNCGYNILLRGREEVDDYAVDETEFAQTCEIVCRCEDGRGILKLLSELL